MMAKRDLLERLAARVEKLVSPPARVAGIPALLNLDCRTGVYSDGAGKEIGGPAELAVWTATQVQPEIAARLGFSTIVVEHNSGPALNNSEQS